MSFNTEKGASEYLFVLGESDCCIVITACRYTAVYFSTLFFARAFVVPSRFACIGGRLPER